jgi:hypothetical protein
MWQSIALMAREDHHHKARPKLGTTSAMYRSMIAGNPGVVPGKKIVTSRPIPKQDLPGLKVDYRPYEPEPKSNPTRTELEPVVEFMPSDDVHTMIEKLKAVMA